MYLVLMNIRYINYSIYLKNEVLLIIMIGESIVDSVRTITLFYAQRKCLLKISCFEQDE